MYQVYHINDEMMITFLLKPGTKQNVHYWLFLFNTELHGLASVVRKRNKLYMDKKKKKGTNYLKTRKIQVTLQANS